MNKLMAMVAFMLTLPIIADTETVGGYSWSYSVVDGHAEITYVEPRRGVVTIPASLGGKPVKSIGCNAFQNSEFTDVTIPNGVTSIGTYAFYNCWYLAHVTMPNSVKSIGSGAFSNCSKLASVVMPNGLTDIGEDAFWGCRELPKISIPNSVTSIGAYAFLGCEKLKNITIPDGVSYIGSQTFSWCYMLSDITIPDSVTDMGYSVFLGCTGLTNVVIGTGLKCIGRSAFQGCTSLAGIAIPQNVTDIGSCAFQSCSNLTCVAMGSGVTNINAEAFRDCVSLADITLPDGVKEIKSAAFSGCSSLSRMTIPKSVTRIEGNGSDEVFLGCIGLTNIHFKGTPPEVESVLAYPFNPIPKGTYLYEHKAAWEAVIDKDGYWKGLEMSVSAPPPLPLTLAVESANWANGSIVFRCTDADTSGATHRYTLQYESTAENWTDIASVQNASAGARLADNGFSYRLGGIPPVKYRVKDETGRASAECVTRNRFILSVGYDMYKVARHYNNGKLMIGPWVKPLKQSLADANEIKRLYVEQWDCPLGNATLLSNSDATTNGIRNAFADFAGRVISGDLFVFYMATHGGDYHVDGDGTIINRAHLCAYDAPYFVDDLLSDVRRFPPSVAVVCTIMACHSQSLIGGIDDRTGYEKINGWLASCGFGQCLRNVVWITSCASSENSYNSGDHYSMFGQAFIHDGFKDGYADCPLYGTEYKGGNRNGAITFGELARYAREFAQGLSDKMPSTVQIEDEGGLLDRIVAGRRIESASQYSCPDAPTSVHATRGQYVNRVNLSWGGTSNATRYRVYRSHAEGGTDKAWVYTSPGDIQCFPDSKSTDCRLAVPYQYQVQAIGPAGKSGLSVTNENSLGWSGTPALLTYLDDNILPGMEGMEYEIRATTVAPNGYTFGESYVAGLDPTNETSKFFINMTMTNGVPYVTWFPSLNTNGVVRNYTIWGKTNLTDEVWHTPTNSASHFFKVTVDMP